MKFSILSISLLFLISCNQQQEGKPSQDTPSLKGTWSITDYQLTVATKLSNKEQQNLNESIERQARKLKEFAQFYFEDSTYKQVFSPQDVDKGKWCIRQDSLLILQSDRYHTPDTAIIHFSGTNKADIKMTQFDQTAIISIQRK